MRKLFSFFIISLIVSCGSENDPEVIDFGYDFYPVSTKIERIYDVSDTNFNLLGSETSVYQLKEYISDSLISETGIVTYILKREKRMDSLSQWESDSLWTFRIANNNLILTENNVSFVKMIFPVIEGKMWDGNAFNSRSSQNYRLEKVTEEIAGLGLDKLIKVVIANTPANLVSQDERHEIYARGIGLVEKYYVTLNFCTANCDDIGQIQSGRILREQLIEYVEK